MLVDDRPWRHTGDGRRSWSGLRRRRTPPRNGPPPSGPMIRAARLFRDFLLKLWAPSQLPLEFVMSRSLIRLKFARCSRYDRRDAVDYLKCRAPTVDRTVEKARSITRDVYVKDRNPDLWVIKDQMGTELAELAIETRPQ
jgi:hypothetical protein